MCAMDESGSPWPGMVFRVSNNNQDEFIANVTTQLKITKKYNMSSLQKVTIKRINGIIYVGTNDGQPTQVLDMTTLTQRFDAPLVFGSSMDGSGNPWRYFNGTLANIKVIVY